MNNKGLSLWILFANIVCTSANYCKTSKTIRPIDIIFPWKDVFMEILLLFVTFNI